MTPWLPRHFKSMGESSGVDRQVLANALAVARLQQAACPKAPPIFSLRHLGHLARVDYAFLRRVIVRTRPEPYRVFRITKRPLPHQPRRYRIIAVPDPRLMSVQRWINANILAHGEVHPSSVAFNENNNIVAAAEPHCGCRWLIKVDIQNFFESISEKAVFRAFRRFGYEPLVAFELARLCTRQGDPRTRQHFARWKTDSHRWEKIPGYSSGVLGHLPQGAPTSPRLANLVAKDLDAAITSIAGEYELVYTRYADDMTLSTDSEQFTREQASQLVGKVYRAIAAAGLSPNKAKTRIASPAARKIVLGLLVDGHTPRLTREYKARLRKHLYFMLHPNVGPAKHAERQGDATIYGLQRHVLGLIQHARFVEPSYGAARLAEFNEIRWP